MDNIKELEQQLAIAKSQKYLEAITQQLNPYRGNVGKCFTSHTFFKSKHITPDKIHTYLAKGRNIYICHIKGLVYGLKWGSEILKLDDPSILNENHLSEDYCAKYIVDYVHITNTIHNGSIQIQRGTDTHEQCNRGGIISPRKEITQKQFEQMWRSIEDAQESIMLRMGSVIPDEPYRDAHEMGTKELEEIGCKFIELNSSDEYLLTGRIPLLWQGKLWVCEQTLTLLENWTRQLREQIARTKDFDYGYEHISAYQMSEYDRNHLSQITNIIERLKDAMK